MTFAPARAPEKKRGVGFWVLIVVLAIIALTFVSCTAALVAGGSNGSGAPIAAPAAKASQEASDDATEEAADDATEEATDEPTEDATGNSDEDASDEPTESPKPSKKEKAYSALSDEQQEAVGEAQDYLDSQAFSKQGLIDQLDSDYGAQYKKKDAQKAVDYLDDYGGVNWNKQAVRAAKEYRDSQHFSTRALIDQLDSDYGGQFTHSQAVYGATHSR